jgi:hypothetical protein
MIKKIKTSFQKLLSSVKVFFSAYFKSKKHADSDLELPICISSLKGIPKPEDVPKDRKDTSLFHSSWIPMLIF